MSGIVGIINTDGQPVDLRLLERMTGYLAFRGPDAQETWSQGPVGLGHTLLRTVDDTRPDCQPLTLDGQVWIVADARVDGRGELRRKLRSHGCSDLEEATDAELILHSYLVWGEACVRHLIGDFAFAIWDELRRRLFGARDHFGVKPFFYARVGNCLVFSNTLNCLRMHPDVSDKLNDLAIADFLLFDFNQDLATTTYADINRVPPAHCLTWQDGVLKKRRYWTLPLEGPLSYARQQDYVDHFTELLAQAVGDRLRTSRIGVFMSGGLDSSTVASHAKAILAAQFSQFDLRAYTIVYNWLIPDEERRFAGLVATHLNIPINFLVADDYKPFKQVESGKICWPEPSFEVSIGQRIDLLKMAQKNCRVILTGEGGDPNFYPSVAYFYDMLKNLHFIRLGTEVGRCVLRYGCLPQIGFRAGVKKLLGKLAAPEYPHWLNKSFASRLDLPARWKELLRKPAPDHPLRPMACKVLLNPAWQFDFETVHDPGATGVPVESRHPLFDVRLITYTFALPPLPWCVDKVMLREAGRGLLPEAVRRRPKAPLAGNPVLLQLRQSQADYFGSLFSSQELKEYVNISQLHSLTEKGSYAKFWSSLRPVSLCYWLKYRRAGNFEKFKNKKLLKPMARGESK
jgi:asparagine synthase (glutamine-hydrolysing)